jgi:hypothetical protein
MVWRRCASSQLQLLLRQELFNTLLGAGIQPCDARLNKTALQARERGHAEKPLHPICLLCWWSLSLPGPNTQELLSQPFETSPPKTPVLQSLPPSRAAP